jgi:hypothetical protein
VDSVIVEGNTYHYANKYKIADMGAGVHEYNTVFRLAEQYLIRAEARAHLNNITGAQDDLNIIRARAGLGITLANDQTQLLAAVQQERRVELFTEWGHRWLDLKRAGNIDTTMPAITSAKGGTWNTNWQWYPIPASEVQRNPNLTQNDDY